VNFKAAAVREDSEVEVSEGVVEDSD